MHTILIVTHGDKEEGVPNPGMTSRGFAQVAALRFLIPACPAYVVCGDGRRHTDVAKALDLAPDRYTGVFGGANSLEIVHGEKCVLLASGVYVPREKCTTPEDMGSVAQAIITALPDQTVICAGRPALIALGKKDAKSGAVYRITVDNGKIESITEVTATGVTEEGAV